MTTTHTPGPWSAHAIEGKFTWSIVHNGPLAYVGDVGEPGRDEANARLLAAAPELLDSAQWVLENLIDVDEVGPDSEGEGHEDLPVDESGRKWWPDVWALRAAIARATNQTQETRR